MTTAPTALWPSAPHPGGRDEDEDGRGPRAAPDVGAPDDTGLAGRLAAAVEAADAPDAVFAVSRHGRRTVRTGGTAPPPPVPREDLRYELGSATKTFTGLLLTRLIRGGALTGGEPAAACLDPGRRPDEDPVTLAHLITHTGGLPALPPGFRRRGRPAWHTNPYACYPAPLVVDAFLRHRPRHRPGTRWRYSNFGVAVLGHAVAAVTGTAWDDLVGEHLLRPFGLAATGLTPEGPGIDATGHTKDGRTRVPPFDAGGFPAAGAVRATPGDLLTFLEAHLDPAGSPAADALRAVRVPVLRRGWDHRHVHTVAWFRHPTDGGPLYFHSGATFGQQAFLGFRPDTGTALAAVCTRRFRPRDPFVAGAYALLAED
ncbi:serine hydrolase domain-containing protein [Streptomyces daghestanicus]|uniref:Penicillin-binding protein n=1 Tax=Streptomyces daghestanicus TaxID=66885 RepID=A0ABQ3QCY5_9ACTN|nr:serine hydrolase domain-containing protein [Streptomyces daghestanicus]GGU14905.1 penicillin-binding protein [Streptomyces daghestanicus]GHI35121.1 penicillin-binding protein [Streptomyces daghestanicus]